ALISDVCIAWSWAYWFLLAEQFLLVVFLVSAGRVVPAGLVNFSLGLTFL
ncbi:hypothetical protein Tco_0056610, partial [Tanacetum coccineum]